MQSGRDSSSSSSSSSSCPSRGKSSACAHMESARPWTAWPGTGAAAAAAAAASVHACTSKARALGNSTPGKYRTMARDRGRSLKGTDSVVAQALVSGCHASGVRMPFVFWSSVLRGSAAGREQSTGVSRARGAQVLTWLEERRRQQGLRSGA